MKVHYHQHNRPPLEAHVIQEHADGTVTLAREAGGTGFVTCILGDKAMPGRATKIEADKKPAPKPAKPAPATP